MLIQSRRSLGRVMMRELEEEEDEMVVLKNPSNGERGSPVILERETVNWER